MESLFTQFNYPLLYVGSIAGIALLLDRLLGEPSYGHPLALFGRWVKVVENFFYPKVERWRFLLGGFGWLCAVIVPWGVIVVGYFLLPTGFRIIVDVVGLYIVIGGKSLAQHGQAVAIPLLGNNLEKAREKLSYIVSRETTVLSEGEVVTATVESMLENAHDAVIAPLFWFVVAGLPGAVLLRMVNTLDAMWGYRSKRYKAFGCIAARADDVMGFFSARVTVLLFGLLNIRGFVSSWKYGRHWLGSNLSPNGLPVMAAGAGALGITLGGDAIYSGQKKQRPVLGDGRKPAAKDILRAIHFVSHSYILLVILIVVLGVFLNMFVGLNK